MLTAVPGKSDKIENVICNDGGVFLKSEKSVIRLALYFEDVLRVSYSETDCFDKKQGEGMLLPDLPLLRQADFSLKELDDEIIISTRKMAVHVLRASGAIKVYKLYEDESSGEMVENPAFSEALEKSHSIEKFDVYKSVGQIKTEEIKTADGVKKRVLAADKEYVESLYHTKLNLAFAPDEKLFGFGQMEEGVWDYRGTTQYLHQANKKIAIPFLISSRGYGLLFTTQSPSVFSDSQYGSYFYTNADYFLDYFVIAPDSFAKIIGRMRSLTGKASLPPDFALGYVQSQERYESQQEILDTVAEFKKRDIPLSLIVLDWLSWEDGMWGQKSFDKKRFPDVPTMVEKLHEENVHFMISIWPTMNEKSENYKEMKEAGTLLSGVNICNAFDEAGRKLYWSQAKRGLADLGVESWWCDSSEPLTPEWNHIEKPLPENIFHEYLQTTSDIMPPQKANAYGLYHARGMFEGQTRDFPDRPVLTLTRSGYPGSQRYGVTLWSGDTSAKWSVLKNQVVQACQFGLSGIPYWTVDIGAFFVKRGEAWYWNGDYPEAAADPAYCELYTRWFQFGAFLPMFRAHGTDCRREPWAFCDKTNVFYDTIVSFIKLRYKFLPYIKQVAQRVSDNDESFIRPLFMEFSDKAVFDISTQFMFGPDILVCPITKSFIDFEKYGVTEGAVPYKTSPLVDVYLPADCDWYDFWTREKLKGGQWIKAEAPIQKMPLFVRDGAEI